jgi:hypothetical protein
MWDPLAELSTLQLLPALLQPTLGLLRRPPPLLLLLLWSTSAALLVSVLAACSAGAHVAGQSAVRTLLALTRMHLLLLPSWTCTKVTPGSLVAVLKVLRLTCDVPVLCCDNGCCCCT